ncbi:MbnP family protein [uncultured Tenacibaculum sp.]|uniref:MbnP family protein n=1 Tax=uncultured Tenacibaculum sp. TaxID=174713 RepID=UPI002606811C|nr:MbnP family protein [uncultured Tenacibaculum sp.]
MNKIITSLITLLLIVSCSSNEDDTLQSKKITINFIHKWDDVVVTKADFNTVKFETRNEDKVSIERYRYVLSNIKLVDANNNETPLSDYLLVDLGEEQNLIFETDKIVLNGTYSLDFTFGFTDEDNKDGEYADLNSANFNVPAMLGGGYHYMQFDGKFTSSTTTAATGFNYHAIRAANITDPANPTYQDTSIAVKLTDIEVTNNDIIIDVNIDINQWFEDPNTWDLNTLNQMLMPNFDAQILMNANGSTVFSLSSDSDS